MSEDKDVLSDDAWDDVPGAEPKSSEPTKPAEAQKPASEPPRPGSTPPRPSPSSPPKPASNPPRPAGASSSILAQPAAGVASPPRETSITKPEGVAARGGTLIGIPAPSVSETPPGPPAEKPSDKPREMPSDKPLANASPVLPGKRTLIGIAAPVIEQKPSASESPKAEAPSGSKPPPAAAASGSRPAEPARAEAPASPSGDFAASQTPSPPAPDTDSDEHKVSRAKSQLASTRKETPKALAEARREARARASKPPDGEKSSRLGPILLFVVAAAAAAWFVISKQRSDDETPNEPAATPPAEVAPQPEKPVEAPAPPPAVTTPEPVATAPASAAQPEASAAASAAGIPTVSADDLPAEPVKGKGKKTPPASSAAEPAPAPAPAAEGTRVVTVHLMPPDAQLFYKGKSVGKTPVRVELGPDEKKRSFEVGRPGYVTRRLIVDGSQPEMWIGLRPESAAPTE